MRQSPRLARRSVRAGRFCASCVATLLALVVAPAAAPAKFLWFGKKPVARIAVAPAPSAVPLAALRPEPPPEGRAACVDVRRVAGAQVFGDHAVELTLSGGARWRMYFARECPTLSFYEGFYYRRAEAGRLCAGRDAVVVRSGGECRIASIMAVPRMPRTVHRRR